MRLRSAGLAVVLACSIVSSALGAVLTTVSLTLKGHQFTPANFSVPAGQKIRVNLVNQDAATEEFDSHDLKVEQLVTPNGHATFTVGPLKPGEYRFMGEFHPEKAQGRVTAIESGR
jgi:plastocyanin